MDLQINLNPTVCATDPNWFRSTDTNRNGSIDTNHIQGDTNKEILQGATKAQDAEEETMKPGGGKEIGRSRFCSMLIYAEKGQQPM